MITRRKRTLLISLSAALIFSNGMVQGAGRKVTAAEAQTATGVNVTYHTQDEIRKYVASNGATTSDALTFAQNPGVAQPYSLGKLSDKTQSSAIAMLNQIRYIAGISDQVVLSDEYAELAQAASLCNYANGSLSHTPGQPSGMTDDMYALAKQGASSTNIAWASWKNCSLNQTIVGSWMEDGDAGNISRVGHRRWLLNPSMGKTGFGAVSGSKGTYSAVYAFDKSNTSAKEYGVMWPAQNMPVEYFDPTYPWSISMGYTVDASQVKITLTRKSDGKNWIFSEANSADGSFYVNNDSYGQRGCIIFRPEKGLTEYNAGDSYQVTITGLSENVSYVVNFFQLTDKKSTSSSSKQNQTSQSKVQKPGKVKLLSLKSTAKKKLKVKWKKISNQNGYQVQCATNRKFTKNKKTFRMSTKASSKTIKGLKSKKTYFVRVRAFRTVSGGKSYGAWSSIKKCKVK